MRNTNPKNFSFFLADSLHICSNMVYLRPLSFKLTTKTNPKNPIFSVPKKKKKKLFKLYTAVNCLCLVDWDLWDVRIGFMDAAIK